MTQDDNALAEAVAREQAQRYAEARERICARPFNDYAAAIAGEKLRLTPPVFIMQVATDIALNALMHAVMMLSATQRETALLNMMKAIGDQGFAEIEADAQRRALTAKARAMQ